MVSYVASLYSLFDLWEQAEVNAEQSRDMKKHTDQRERETVFPSASWGMSVSHKLTAPEVSNRSSL